MSNNLKYALLFIVGAFSAVIIGISAFALGTKPTAPAKTDIKSAGFMSNTAANTPTPTTPTATTEPAKPKSTPTASPSPTATPEVKPTVAPTRTPAEPLDGDRASSKEYITGPRGGCYYINGSGNKTYVDHSFCGQDDTPSYSAPAVRSAPADRGYIRGPRGGCYYINGNGNKTYVDRSMCD